MWQKMQVLLQYGKQYAEVWSSKKVNTFAGAVAYYAIFSLAPLLLIAVSLMGFFIEEGAAEQVVLVQFQETFGERSAALIEDLLQSAVPGEPNVLLALFGALIVFFGATSVFSQLQSGLDTLFNCLPEKSARTGAVAFIMEKLLAFCVVMGIGIFLLISLVASAALLVFTDMFAALFPGASIFFPLLEHLLSFALMAGFLILLYRLLPTKRLAWPLALRGGMIAAALFMVSEVLLGFYFGSGAAFSAFGGAAALVLLVVWMYYLSLLFFASAVMVRVHFLPPEGEATC